MDKRRKEPQPQPPSSKTDPFLLNYQPSELQIASEFLSTWLPFLSRDLCRTCSKSLSDRIRSIDPGSQDNHVDENSHVRLEDNDVDDNNCNAHSLGSWKDEAKGNSISNSNTNSNLAVRMSWADMAQEDDEFGEEEEEDENDLNESNLSVVVAENNRVVNEKPKLPREQREYIRFMNVRRKTDFICFERVHGKLVNILDGLELHTGIFSAAEQRRIVNYVATLQEMGKNGELKDRTYSAPQKWMRGKGRQTIQFGCCYNYAVDKNGNPPGILKNAAIDPLPHLFKVIIRHLVRWHVLPPTCVPDSCIVNVYEEGDCIPPHIDNHDFVRPFCTVSFLSECNILFGSNLRIVGPGEFDGSFAIPLPVGSVLVLNGNGADVAKHCVPAVPTKRISITFRRMDESKRPFDYFQEPDLEGIQPLPYEVEQEKEQSEFPYEVEQEKKQNEYRPNPHIRRHQNRRGGRIDARGSGTGNDRFSEPREWTPSPQRSGGGRNDAMGSGTRADRFSETREWTQSSQRSSNKWSRVKPRN